MAAKPASLVRQRCWNHPGREAVACCPDCRRYYCRECVVEHQDRVLCAACLRQLSEPSKPPHPAGAWLGPLARWGAGLLLAWMVFHGLGRALLSLPDPVHEGGRSWAPWEIEP